VTAPSPEHRQAKSSDRATRLILRGEPALTTFLDAVAREPRRAALFCDVDGTISPIAPTPADAVVPNETRELLADLVEALGLVVFVTGRDAREGRRLVGLDGVTYVGNHGLELLQPDGSLLLDERAEPYVSLLKALTSGARAAGLTEAGVLLEDKRTVVAAHYRTAPDQDAAREAIERLFASPARAMGLRIATGHCMVEARPPVEAGKGEAVRRLLEVGDWRTALFAGDDLTDCTGFTAVRAWATGNRSRLACAVAAITDETPDPVRKGSDVWVAATPGVTCVLQRLLAAAAQA